MIYNTDLLRTDGKYTSLNDSDDRLYFNVQCCRFIFLVIPTTFGIISSIYDRTQSDPCELNNVTIGWGSVAITTSLINLGISSFYCYTTNYKGEICPLECGKINLSLAALYAIANVAFFSFHFANCS